MSTKSSSRATVTCRLFDTSDTVLTTSLPHTVLMLLSVPILITPIVFSSLQLISRFKTLARIILLSDSLALFKPLLQQLHWLRDHSIIRSKLATITYKALSFNSHQYRASHIKYCQPVRSPRSSDQHYLLSTPLHRLLTLALVLSVALPFTFGI